MSLTTDLESKCFTARVLNLIRSEIAKSENKQRIKDVVDPIVWYAWKGIQPYILFIIVLLAISVVCQGYLVVSTWRARVLHL